MKKLLSLFGVALVVALSFTLSACGGNKTTIGNDEKTLQIQAYEAGYGIDGIKAVADAYMAEHPDTTIVVVGAVDATTLARDAYIGPSITTDLYFDGADGLFNMITVKNPTIGGVVYDNYFEDLTEVYEYTPVGETLKIKDKMIDAYEENYNVKDLLGVDNDIYYSAPWSRGFSGIVYNAGIFEERGYEIPLTTDELYALCIRIKNDTWYSTNKLAKENQEIQVFPFSYCAEDSYWANVYNTWWAQYDGLTTFTNFFKGQDSDGEYSEEIAYSQGRLQSAITLDSFIGTYTDGVYRTDKLFCDPSLCSENFIQVQANFLAALGARINLNGGTTSLMMPNGDWLENEMYTNYQEDIESGKLKVRCMNTPIVSAIINHPDCATIENDSELSALIKAIDAGSKSLTGNGYEVDQKAFDKIYEARKTVVASNRYNIYMPVFSNAKELGKDFLKFLFSDKGLKAYAKATRGEDLPFNVDWASFEGTSPFHKATSELLATYENYTFTYDRNAVNYRGKLKAYPAIPRIEDKMNVSSARDYQKPEDIFLANAVEFKRLYSQFLRDADIEW